MYSFLCIHAKSFNLGLCISTDYQLAICWGLTFTNDIVPSTDEFDYLRIAWQMWVIAISYVSFHLSCESSQFFVTMITIRRLEKLTLLGNGLSK